MFVPLYINILFQIEPASPVKSVFFNLWIETLSKIRKQEHKQVLRIKQLQ